MVNVTLLNFGKKYEDERLRVIFGQWPKLHLGLDVRPEIPTLKGLYYVFIYYPRKILEPLSTFIYENEIRIPN